MRTVPAAVLTMAISLWRSSLIAEDAPPWRTHRPIVLVQKELYREHPRPGAAALVSQTYVGPGLERLETQAVEARDDVPSEGRQRRSSDNGRTWSGFEDLPPTIRVLKGVEVWEGSGARLHDPGSGVLLEVWLRQIAQKGFYNNFTYYRLSRDQGRTWSAPRQLRYEGGAEFDPDDPLRTAFLERNQAYFGSNILRRKDGTLVHAVAHARAPDDPENDRRPWRMGSLCFLGRWDSGAGDYRWTAGERIGISPRRSSRGLMEPEVAELRDGRLFIVWRGSDTAETPGRKWFSTSGDGGNTLAPVEELTYDDGSRFYSPSSFHRMVRRGGSGKLYWLGNISATPPRGNSPRYPLVIAEVEEERPSLRRSTVTAIDDRGPGQGEGIQLSNFSLLEDRETKDLELYLTLYGADPGNVFSAGSYRYRLTFP